MKDEALSDAIQMTLDHLYTMRLKANRKIIEARRASSGKSASPDLKSAEERSQSLTRTMGVLIDELKELQ